MSLLLEEIIRKGGHSVGKALGAQRCRISMDTLGWAAFSEKENGAIEQSLRAGTMTSVN